MIVSNNASRSRWLKAYVLFLAVAVLPLLGHAQDVEAVAKRLGEAVEQGELTREQAGMMLGILKKMSAKEAKQCEEKDELEVHLERVWAKLQGAVKRGDISQDEAHAKMSAIKKEKLGDGESRVEEKQVAARIKAAVKRGEISEEDGRQRWEAYLNRGQAVERGTKMKPLEDAVLERIGGWAKLTGERIKAAVKDGELSEEDAWRRWIAFKERELGPKLRETVASGEVSQEKARDFWKAIEGAETGERIKAAIARGDMTEKEAIGLRLKAAIKRGDMTEREAKAKWAEMTGDTD
jgi:polyhydroxyalkanoate synthesis regulator phasin